jgi:hypothetical protein
LNRTKQESVEWIFISVLKFKQFQLDGANNKEITGSTVRNYLKSIKLFCEMADFSIGLKKISRITERKTIQMIIISIHL